MVDIEAFVQQHGGWVYALTVAGTFLEGETFVLLTAAAAATLHLDPIRLGLCAWFGSAVGDQCWFFAGRFYGPWALKRWSKAQAGIDFVHRWLDRWDAAFILTYRFMYGIRNVSSIALGLSQVHSLRFILLNTVAAGLWAATFVGAGVLFGRAACDLLGRYAAAVEIGLALVFVLLVVLIGALDRERRARLVAWSRRR
jgi:membrane protein DedA with SNARE-associated domain